MVSGLLRWVSGEDLGIFSVAAQAVRGRRPQATLQHKPVTRQSGSNCCALADL